MFAGKDFLKMEPPKGYKPGIGRGALGFSTRGNIGVPDQRSSASAAADRSTETDRFLDSDTEVLNVQKTNENKKAAEIYAKIDNRRGKNKKTLDDEDDLFEDLRPKLSTVSEQEWLNIPDSMDFTFRNKRLRQEGNETRRQYAVPDSQLVQAITGSVPDFAQLTKVDPKNPTGWVKYAENEYKAMNFKKARSVIEKGCKKCPQSEDVWLTSLKVHEKLTERRAIVREAVHELPNSINLWLRAIEIEDIDSNKLKVVHQAIENNPEKGDLWVIAANLEEDSKLRALLLEQAVQMAPDCPQLWLMYFRELKDESILDKALVILPNCRDLLLERAFSGESNGCRDEWIADIVSRLPQDSTDWHSLVNEQSKYRRTCEAILKRFDLDPLKLNSAEMRKMAFRTRAENDPSWYIEWAKNATTEDEIKESMEHAVSKIPTEDTWELYVSLVNSLDVLRRAHELYPSKFSSLYSERLGPLEALDIFDKSESKSATEWYEYASLLSKHRTSEAAIQACEDAIKLNKGYGPLYLLLYKLSKDTNILKIGTRNAPHEIELWLELSRQAQSETQKRAILTQAIANNPKSPKLWIERVYLEKRSGNQTQNLLETAIRECPQSGEVWVEYLGSLSDIKRKAKFAEALKATNNDPDVLFALGMYYEQRKKKEAMSIIQEAANKGSEKARLWINRNS